MKSLHNPWVGRLLIVLGAIALLLVREGGELVTLYATF
jgi:hypothetical protein